MIATPATSTATPTSCTVPTPAKVEVVTVVTSTAIRRRRRSSAAPPVDLTTDHRTARSPSGCRRRIATDFPSPAISPPFTDLRLYSMPNRSLQYSIARQLKVIICELLAR
jgi:hypothetical protein